MKTLHFESNNPIVLVDMDSTICNFTDKVCRMAHERLEVPLLTSETCDLFNTEDMYEEKHRVTIARFQHEEGFYVDLEPIAGAITALNEMRKEGYEVFICTAPSKFYNNPHCVGEKHRWIMNHLGKEWTERVILSRDKTLVAGTVLIDDKPEIIGAAKPVWAHVYYDQPYNRSREDRPRIVDWSKWREVLYPILGK
jgi:5'-nucleotidase